MGRGLITGLIFGAVFSGAGLVTLSLVNDLPIDGTPPVADATTTGVGAKNDAPNIDAGDVTDESPIVADTDAGLAPQTPSAPESLPTPDIESTPAPEAALQTGNVGALPDVQTDAPSLPVSPDANETPRAVQSPAAGIADSAPLIEGSVAQEPETETAAQDADPETVAEPEVVVENVVDNVPVDEIAPEPLIEDETPAVETPANETAEVETPEIAEIPAEIPADTPAPRLGIGTGSNGPIGGGSSTRLPSVTADDDVVTAAPEAPEEPVENLPALVAYGAAYDGDLIGPMMSALFIDVPSARPTNDILAAMPIGTSFAVDPASDGAAEAIALYRGAGHEVLLVLQTPNGARPTDIDQLFQSTITDFPEVIGVISDGTSGFQSNRAQVQQVITNLADAGHGLVVYPQGLNAALQLAQKEGVAAALMTREIDGAGETTSAMSRILSRIAFQASKDQTAIALGHTGTGALGAFGDWVAAGKTNGVTIAPVSVLLQLQ